MNSPEAANATPAQHAVWAVVAAIPRGRVMTYAQVADRAGLGRAARMVSSALRKAPPKMQLPWQRVINSQGKISFPKDSAEYIRQYELLCSEGVVFIKGRLNLNLYQADAVIDEQLWSGFFER
ncbi:MAG: methylated-DNA--[protein]-cysteine S-methyltransferase [Xanthomonadales bacterium]|nr:methylated-DNA--[protein]-cysteine S-methyltransferase [Xanthomonadales bacterium]